ncbi:MerR family transcriptional regulator [Pseudomonas aeruginosa]|uniref:MerR family transcriptional regulator n=1 Tax=Pseudomonas aeruginosa TaxID=287 RepID=UPI0030053B2E
MSAVTAIQYTQDQMRTLTGVSAETVRHWRKTVPYLASKTGKAARFTFADLLGLAVTNELVSSLGVHIATVSVGVDALFRLLSTSGALALNGSVAFVTPTLANLCDIGPEGVGAAAAPPPHRNPRRSVDHAASAAHAADRPDAEPGSVAVSTRSYPE